MPLKARHITTHNIKCPVSRYSVHKCSKTRKSKLPGNHTKALEVWTHRIARRLRATQMSRELLNRNRQRATPKTHEPLYTA